MSKKKVTKKPRCIQIEGNLPKDIDFSNGFQYVITNNKIELHDFQGNVIPLEKYSVSSLYEREKKNKVLNKVTNLSDSITVNNALLKFDLFYAFDTNTKFISNRYISISAMLKIIYSEKTETFINFNGKLCEYFIWDSEKEIPNPERNAWVYAIDFIKKDIDYTEDINIGLIVDPYLGDIEDFNTGKTPIYEDIFLPPNIKLIYASADSGKEYMPNFFISKADKHANAFYKQLCKKMGYIELNSSK